MIQAIIHGVILSFGLILPLGAQNVFIFNQGAMKPRFIQTLPAVATACLCDTLLISLAVLGVSVVVFTFQWLQLVLFTLGIAFLLYMGWSIWRSKPQARSEQQVGLPVNKQIAFAASVSLLNPHAVIDTIGVIGTSSIHYAGEEKFAFSAACILVSWIWFFGLALCGKWVGRLDSTGKALSVINKISALFIWGVAAYLAMRLIFS